MTDISCRLTRSLLSHLTRTGVSVEAILSKTRARLTEEIPSTDFLIKSSNRVTWEFFAAFLDVLDEELPPNWEVDYFEADLRDNNNWLPYLRDMASLISSPLQAYRMVNVLSGPSLFGSVVRAEMVITGPRDMITTLTIQKPHRDSQTFFRLSKTGMRVLPRMMGLENSIVRAEISERQARYTVTTPPSRTLMARLIRGAKLAFSFDQFVDELSTQEKFFRENYAQLERIVATENENRELQERLFHLQKIEAIGTLASGISHEMNNVLQGLVLSLDLAGRNVEPGSPAKASIVTAQKFASRGRDVMKQLLGFSRKARAERTWMDVVSTVQEAIDMIRSIIPRSISIRQLYPASRTPLTIYGDRTQIQQVVINLASNAIHAMRAHGGEIVVEVRDLGRDCAIVVRDDGSGIDPEIQLHIFEPFFTTKPVGEGTGMGLSVVQGIVNSHLGRIDITPGLAKGSEFVITLPLSSAPPAEQAAESVSEDVLLQGGDETILVVDDEADLTDVIADTLEIFGYTVLKAHNAEEALKLVESRGSEIDLILTDDSMPGMTGLEFAVHLRKSSLSSLEIPVVLMTGYYRHEPAEHTECAAIQAFLRKPLDAEVLNEVIRTTLDRP